MLHWFSIPIEFYLHMSRLCLDYISIRWKWEYTDENGFNAIISDDFSGKKLWQNLLSNEHLNQKTLQTLQSHQDFVSTTSFCLFLRHLQFVLISGNSEKSYRKIVKMAEFCKKIFLHLGLPKPNANSGHAFFNWFE